MHSTYGSRNLQISNAIWVCYLCVSFDGLLYVWLVQNESPLLTHWRYHIHALGHWYTIQYSKVNGANMGPTWVLSAPDGPHVGPMNLAIRDIIPIRSILPNRNTPINKCQIFFYCPSGITLDILKMESWTADIIIKAIIHIFASSIKNMPILLMGRCYHECCP